MALSVFKNGVISTNVAKIWWLPEANNNLKKESGMPQSPQILPFSQSCYKIILYYDLQKMF